MGIFDTEADDAEREDGRGLFSAPAGPASTSVFPRPAAQAAVQPPGTTLDSIPAPYQPVGDGDLSAQEEADLAACEAGVDNLRTAFWIAGKSLETMRTAELTRKRHPNFAQYVWDRWEISESQMHRLIQEWPLGDRIAKLGLRPKESQVRELVPCSQRYGSEAAAAVYSAYAETAGKVTAKGLSAVVESLPDHLQDGDGRTVAPDEVATAVKRIVQSAADDGAGVPVITSAQAPQQRTSPEGDVPALKEGLVLLEKANRKIKRARVQRAEQDSDATDVIASLHSELEKLQKAVQS